MDCKGLIFRTMLLMSLLLCSIPAQGRGGRHIDIADEEMARERIDSSICDAVEGIWDFPYDEMRVLIVRDRTDRSLYQIAVVFTPDCRLRPGDVVGTLRATGKMGKYEMMLNRKTGFGALASAMKCSAELDAKAGTLQVQVPKVKFSLRPTMLLPQFWRMLRLSVDNPIDRLPSGLTRVYPDPSRLNPDYL